MSDYQLTATDSVIRTADGACIPNDPVNRDWVEYQEWLDDGGTPDPYVPPEPAPAQPTGEQTVLFEHENRIRALEGQPPISPGDFIKASKPVARPPPS
jgi:hypothetical protein